MRVMTLFGTRPEIIRLSQVIKLLDRFCEQTLVHTGQNYAPNLSDMFLRELNIRNPDIHLGVRALTFAEQIGQILTRSGEVMARIRPEKLLILGDTNSALAAIVGARMGIPVYHLEAGNRCYDDRVPEEINRRVVDHCSTVLMPYTNRSMQNLVREGIERERIFVTGNPIFEVLKENAASIDNSDILQRLEIRPKEYFLATMHRTENVDQETRLVGIMHGLLRIATRYKSPIVVSLHPRTADKINTFGIDISDSEIQFLKPMGFFDFVALEKGARAVISDSGTVQEECTIFGIPNVTIREVTERPETLEAGATILAGIEPEALETAVEIVLGLNRGWAAPTEYTVKNVSQTVVKIVMGHVQAIS